VTNAQTHGPLAGAVVRTSAGHLTATDAAGRYSATAAPGTFDMTASKATFLPASAAGITVTEGGTTVADFALTPTPVLMSRRRVRGQRGELLARHGQPGPR